MNVLQLGQRAQASSEVAFARKQGVKAFTSREIQKALGKVKSELASVTNHQPVYITIDVDVLEAGLVPGTGTPEPDGLTFGQVVELLKGVKGRIAGLDLVEAAPDSNRLTQTIASELLVECLAGLPFP